MKTLSVCSVLLVFSILTSFGQAPRPLLDVDFAFQKALKEIKYPNIQHLTQETTILFASFIINQQGKITNVKYINEDEVDNSFVSEVSRIFWHFPTQKPNYTGGYILPIVFGSEIMQREKRDSSIQRERLAYIQTFKRVYKSPRPLSLLSKVYVLAYN